MAVLREGVTLTIDEAFKSMLAAVSTINITVDTWTAPNYLITLTDGGKQIILSWEKTDWSPLRDPNAVVPPFPAPDGKPN